MGSATRWWLHHSLDALRGDLSKLNIKLILKRGATAEMVAQTANEVGATTVHAMAVHEPAEAEQVERVEERLRRDGRTLAIAGGNLLHPPGTILNKQGGGYKVFTPYWKSWRTFNPSTPLPVPSPVAVSSTECASDNLDAWHLLPSKPDWALGLRETWRPAPMAPVFSSTRSSKARLATIRTPATTRPRQVRHDCRLISILAKFRHAKFGMLCATRLRARQT